MIVKSACGFNSGEEHDERLAAAPVVVTPSNPFQNSYSAKEESDVSVT
jgi:hypothetical protein